MKSIDNHLFSGFLIQVHGIDVNIMLDALERQRKQTTPIGRLAMDLRYMSVRQVMDTLFAQGDSKKRFGEWAIELGFITQENILALLKSQENEKPKLIDILIDMNAIKSNQRDSLMTEFEHWEAK